MKTNFIYSLVYNSYLAMKIQIKNMVCPRCITSVENVLGQLEIPFEKVDLGEAVLKQAPESAKKEALREGLKKVGFELITDKHHRISNKVKSMIIDEMYKEDKINTENLSSLLSSKLHLDYSQLSSIFSKTEGRSIQQYYRDVKIMRVKELLEYDELGIAEIADKLGYGNAAYLSTHFKEATGMTPSAFKKQEVKNREPLDKL